MIVDFHTHIFPDQIADKAVESLKKSSGYKNAIGGKASDLILEMAKSGVDLSVNMPILTNFTNFDKTIEKLIVQNETYGDKIISFACIHPLCDNLSAKIKFIKESGFKGVKIHPFFQDVAIDRIENQRLIGLCEENELYTMVHAGFDASFPGVDMATPNQILATYNVVKPKRVILAHMGAQCYWEQVKADLVGIDCYFDTSFSMHMMDKELFESIVLSHGSNKVLFGTDSPWISQTEYVNYFNSCNFSSVDRDNVLYKNALKILQFDN